MDRLRKKKVVMIITVPRPDFILIPHQRSTRGRGRCILWGETVRLPPFRRSARVFVKVNAHKNITWMIIRQFRPVPVVHITVFCSR